MRRPGFLSLLLLLTVPLGACCANGPSIEPQELYCHVRWLASDSREGRRTGSDGAAEAARYLAERLEEAGLEPAGEDGSYFQWFEVELPPEPGPSSLQIQTLIELDAGTVAGSPTGVVTAPAVAAGYGVVDPEHDQDDFAAADVAGKVVVVRRYVAQGPLSDEARSLGSLRRKIRAAEAAGAVGVVLGTHPDDVERGGEAVIPFAAAPGRFSVPVVTVSPEVLEDLEWRIAQEGGELDAVTVRTVVERPRVRARNVLALAPGAGPEVVVVGAHYDHLGWGGEGSLAPGVHAIHNGADDNASGTATVLEIAEMFGRAPIGPRPRERGLLFAFWDAEELGLLGSQHWVRNPTVPIESVVANVNLDMVGRPNDHRYTVGSVDDCAAFRPALEHARAVMRDEGFLVDLKPADDRLPGGGGSDHMSFQNAGIPAVFFFSGLHTDYHKPSDDYPKLDYEDMTEVAYGVAWMLVELLQAPSDQFLYQEPEPDPHAGGADAGPVAMVWFGSIPDYGSAPEGGGMAIAGVGAGSPAEKAGLRGGDVIRRVGRFEVADIYDFMDALGAYHTGDTVEVDFLRDGELHTVSLTFFPRPNSGS